MSPKVKAAMDVLVEEVSDAVLALWIGTPQGQANLAKTLAKHGWTCTPPPPPGASERPTPQVRRKARGR